MKDPIAELLALLQDEIAQLRNENERLSAERAQFLKGEEAARDERDAALAELERARADREVLAESDAKEPGQVAYETHRDLSIASGVDHMRFSDWRLNQAKENWAKVEIAVLESAGVERLRLEFANMTRDRDDWANKYGRLLKGIDEQKARAEAAEKELERSREHNRILTTDIEGWKRNVELLREMAEAHEKVVRHAGERRDARILELEKENAEFEKDRDEQKALIESIAVALYGESPTYAPAKLPEIIRGIVERARQLQAAADEQKERADRADRLARALRDEVDRAFRKHGLSADPNCVDRLVEQRDAEKARADRAVEAWKEANGYDDLLSAYSAAGDRIAALEKVVRSAANLLDGTDAVTLYPTGFVACAFNELRSALDSAQPAPEAGKCAQPSEHHESCNCENQPAPDARDERIRAFKDAARTVPEDTVRLSERLDAANERIRELESECGLAKALLLSLRSERIRELEAELEQAEKDYTELDALLQPACAKRTADFEALEARVRELEERIPQGDGR